MGVIAVLLGIVGIRKTSNRQMGGKGMAITGLILGLLNLLFYVPVSYIAYGGYQASLSSRPPAEQFLRGFEQRQCHRALPETTGIAQADLQSQYDNMLKAWGPLQSINWQFSWSVGSQADTNGTQTVSTLVGNANFANATRQVVIIMEKQGGHLESRELPAEVNLPSATP